MFINQNVDCTISPDLLLKAIYTCPISVHCIQHFCSLFYVFFLIRAYKIIVLVIIVYRSEEEKSLIRLIKVCISSNNRSINISSCSYGGP